MTVAQYLNVDIDYTVEIKAAFELAYEEEVRTGIISLAGLTWKTLVADIPAAVLHDTGYLKLRYEKLHE